MNIDELKDLYKIFIEKRASVQQTKELAELYRGIFHKEITACGCKSALTDGIMELINHEKNKDKLFALSAGVALLHPAFDKYDCNHRTLTDEKALFHLRLYPDKIKFFTKYPENWKELCEKGLPGDYDKFTDDELKLQLIDIAYLEKDFEGKTRLELIKMIQEG